MRDLIIDPEFRDKIPPLSSDEFEKLEENILADGEVREPLVLWSRTIIDGHHRWAIIQKHPEIPYKVKQMTFEDKWAAIAWMCSNQLGRRNLTDEQKTYLLGKQYEAQKLTVGGDRKSSLQNEDLNGLRTKDIIAKQHGVGSSTVERAEHFAKGLDEAEAVSQGIREAVLTGTIKAPKKVISEIRRLPGEKKVEVVEAIKRNAPQHELKAIVQDKPYAPIPNATPVEPAPPYDLNDFLAELDSIVKNTDASFKQTLVLAHREMLNTKDGRNVALSVLHKAHESIAKYERMIEEVEKNESI